MISVAEATKIVMKHIRAPSTLTLPLEEAHGLCLREPVVADRDFPPFDRVMMDGIAIRHQSWEGGNRSFKIMGRQMAGSLPLNLKEDDGAIEVMTGAMLPDGVDAVIRYEDFEVTDGVAMVEEITVKKGMNIHPQGTDQKSGTVLITEGKILGPAEIGVLATVGKARVKATPASLVAIVSTGDELVPVTAEPAPYQIRMSNSFTLRAALEQHRIHSNIFHLRDNKKVLTSKLDRILNTHHILILSGGVSKGKTDFVPEVLDGLGVKKLFHGVRQRPGKPFWFGITEDGKPVFALPGNPVSTALCFYKYVLPWILKSMGHQPIIGKASLAEDFSFNPDLTYFLQVKLKRDASGSLLATPCPGQGSGDLANLLEVDGFLELPEAVSNFKKGEVFDVLRMGSI